MDYSANHPEHVAVENCELCGRRLCALCLWYGTDGRRLCEVDAKEIRQGGEEVFPLANCADAIQNPPIVQAKAAKTGDEPVVRKGNSPDVGALVSAVLAVTALSSCCGGVRQADPLNAA